MSGYYGIFSCGHEGRVNVIGPQKYRQYKIEQRFSGLCPECYKKYLKEEREKRNLVDAEVAKEMELPELQGTEKQVAWANTLRNAFIERIEKSKEDKNFADTLKWELNISRLEAKKVINNFDDILEEIMIKDEARFFIDNRDRFNRTIFSISKEIEKIKEEINNGAEEVILESTVAPAEIKYDGIVEIKFDDNTVKACYEKNNDFRSIVKSLRFSWENGCWQRKISESTGTASDRAAELGNKLLNSGFSICILDEETRNKAVNADYEIECDRWIYRRKDTSKLAVNWVGYDDSLYRKASKLPGAKWGRPSVLVDVSHYKEVQEFAELMDFKFSESALELIENYKKEFENVPIVEVVNSREYIEKDGLEDILNSSREVLDDLMEEE